MHAVELVFGLGWGAFRLYWLVAAFSMKRGLHRLGSRIPWAELGYPHVAKGHPGIGDQRPQPSGPSPYMRDMRASAPQWR